MNHALGVARFLHIDSMLNANICYTFVVMATNSDVIMTSSVVKTSDFNTSDVKNRNRDSDGRATATLNTGSYLRHKYC